MTPGDSGAILTNNGRLYGHTKHLTTTAMQQHRWIYLDDQASYNLRIPNMSAALGWPSNCFSFLLPIVVTLSAIKMSFQAAKVFAL